MIVGTRPQVIKSASIVHEAKKSRSIDLHILHTGQHYDFEMSRIFYEELGISEPFLLRTSRRPLVGRIGGLISLISKTVLELKPDVIVVPGDTDSALAAAIAGAKHGFPVAHVEAGARCYDWSVPEELNRRLIDHCSRLLFTVSKHCTENLLRENLKRGSIHQVGDTMFDLLKDTLPKISSSRILDELDLEPDSYGLITIHRSENTDEQNALSRLVKLVDTLSDLRLVFPIHPRTKKSLARFGLLSKLSKQSHVRLIKPLGYLDALKLVKEASVLLTDSGGLQKEAFWLHTPCITLRRSTEWLETIELGANFLMEFDAAKVRSKILDMVDRGIKAKLRSLPNPYGDGGAAKRIIAAVVQL